MVSPLLSRFGTINGNNSADEVLTGAAGVANTFYFEIGLSTGKDIITNLEKIDILVTDKALFDSNGDGFVTFSKDKVLNLDAPNSLFDTVKFTGIDPTKGLRALGETSDGLFVYADATVRPLGAIESSVGVDILDGDDSNGVQDVFFFDTALAISLTNGNVADSITDFGSNDLIVTTTKVRDNNDDGIITFGKNKILDLSSGTVKITSTNDNAVTSLEFDGQVTHNGVDYYVYSRVGSVSVGVDDLFGLSA